MANKKAFARYADNKLVPGSTIIALKPPKVGIWKEIPYDLCCVNTTSTTTTACPDCPTFCTENWMFENFDGTTFRNGDIIPEVTNDAAWAALTTPAWCYYDNDPANGQIYGKLYNWYAVNDPRGLAPVGWRVATDEDWTALTTCLGGQFIVSGKMKTTGTIEDNTGLWYSPNTGATNESGFSGLPGGFRLPTGAFLTTIGYRSTWWSSTEGDTLNAWNRFLLFNSGSVFRQNLNKTYGFSVRLIKDI
jgi:uncharacterized protein (TIGR02145 family)